MRQITTTCLIMLLFTVFANPLYARSAKLPLHKVIYPVRAEAWVTTETAKVRVSINATVDKSGLAKIRSNVLKKLQTIAPSKWHLTRFDQRQDNSGLERVVVEAEARLPSSQLTGLRDKAKSLSQPGETFRIASIDFKPSRADKDKVEIALREQVYQKVKAELGRLNAIYPSQKYQVYRINFLPMRLQANRRGGQMKTLALAATPASLAVSDKLMLQAVVILAAPIKGMATK